MATSTIVWIVIAVIAVIVVIGVLAWLARNQRDRRRISKADEIREQVRPTRSTWSAGRLAPKTAARARAAGAEAEAKAAEAEPQGHADRHLSHATEARELDERRSRADALTRGSATAETADAQADNPRRRGTTSRHGSARDVD